MNWQRIKCSILGHRWAAPMWASYPHDCRRCGEKTEGVKHRPAPPMPACKPWSDVKAAPTTQPDTLGTMTDCVRLSVRPGDTVVITSPDWLTSEQRARITASVAPKLPDGVKVLVLDAGMKLSVVGKGAIPVIPKPQPRRRS